MNCMDITDLYHLALGKNKSPDHWQKQFAKNNWPEVLIAPTGAGKTAGVTLGWAAHRISAPRTTPRRLVWCLPMRALVEQTEETIRRWFDKLHACDRSTGLLPTPDDIHVLMGGVEAARWIKNPDHPAVIIGTQDMLLSRALMRGYASSRTNWPMEFALLHEDAQWVFDEVQLMGAGLATSAQLEAFRRFEADRFGQGNQRTRCPARSLWISATMKPNWLKTVDFVPDENAVRRVEPKKGHDTRLWRLATAKKTLEKAKTAPTSPKKSDINNYVEKAASEILSAHRQNHMTLVIVNQVSRAQILHKTLTEEIQKKPGNAPGLALVHGRFRLGDRQKEMSKVVAKDGSSTTHDLIVVATQAVEAGVDISAAVLFTELAPWPAMVQRFGRANRYAELKDGAKIFWLDLFAKSEGDKAREELSRPYSIGGMEMARKRLRSLADVAPENLHDPGKIEPPRHVIRRKDLDDLFDTDSDLMGFDVDISLYVRDADNTDVRVFWRNLSTISDDPPRPHREELCAIPIGLANSWLKKLRISKNDALVFVRDLQWRREDGQATQTAPLGWVRLTQDPWPGLTLLADMKTGGYSEKSGFTGVPEDVPNSIIDTNGPPNQLTKLPHSDAGGESEGHDEDPWSEIGVPVLLSAHLDHVATEAKALCDSLEVDADSRCAVVRAARWHDLGKVHDVFQDTMRRGLVGDHFDECGLPLAKTVKKNMRHKRACFRHELASALAFLAHEKWSRDADLVAYLIAAHHGKVRMNLRALPRERMPSNGDHTQERFARGIWENDELGPANLGGGEQWPGGRLTLSVMELGWDETTGESWTERTRDLLTRFGPFRLAWMETLVRLADWQASAKEQEGCYGGV